MVFTLDCSSSDGMGSSPTLVNELITRCRWLQASNERLQLLNTLKFSVWFSRGAGLALSADITIILLPMCRNLLRFIRPKIRWLPLDESQWFHRQVSYSLLFWTIVHVSSHYVKYVGQYSTSTAAVLIATVSSTSRDFKRDQKRQCRSTTRKQQV